MASTVKISELPLSIQTKIPMSIRAYKDEYTISNLPFDIQYLVEDYLQRQKTVSYDTIYDCKPTLSAFGDLETIDNVHDLVLEYISNYLTIPPKSYPFDVTFYSKLSTYVSTLDSDVRSIYIADEIKNIIRIVQKDTDLDISVDSFDVKKASSGIDIEYSITLILLINGVKKELSVGVS